MIIVPAMWFSGWPLDPTLGCAAGNRSLFNDPADSATYAYPSILGDRILIKDKDRLTLWSFKGTEAPYLLFPHDFQSRGGWAPRGSKRAASRPKEQNLTSPGCKPRVGRPKEMPSPEGPACRRGPRHARPALRGLRPGWLRTRGLHPRLFKSCSFGAADCRECETVPRSDLYLRRMMIIVPAMWFSGLLTPLSAAPPAIAASSTTPPTARPTPTPRSSATASSSRTRTGSRCGARKERRLRISRSRMIFNLEEVGAEGLEACRLSLRRSRI